MKAFVDRHPELIDHLEIPGVESPSPSRADVECIASKYLVASKEAASTYNHIVKTKGSEEFITEFNEVLKAAVKILRRQLKPIN